jgi:hypothetical protein
MMCGTSALRAAPFKVTPGDDRVRIEIDGNLFTEYIFKGEGVGLPVLWPVMGPGQTRMTRDYPFKKGTPDEASDHPHHAGLWFTHGDVNKVDFWHHGGVKKGHGTVVQAKRLKAEATDSGAVIVTENDWLDGSGKRICADTRTISFSQDAEGNRAIDYTVQVRATDGDLTFGDTKEGSMAIRTHPALRIKGKVAKGKALNSGGAKDAALWGKAAAWVDYYGPVDGNTVGVAIFDHPDNPRHPTTWHARDYGLIAANPFGLSYFQKKPRGAGDLKVKAGENVTFKYRFLFHRGDVTAAKIADQFSQWAGK